MSARRSPPVFRGEAGPGLLTRAYEKLLGNKLKKAALAVLTTVALFGSDCIDQDQYKVGNIGVSDTARDYGKGDPGNVKVTVVSMSTEGQFAKIAMEVQVSKPVDSNIVLECGVYDAFKQPFMKLRKTLHAPWNGVIEPQKSYPVEFTAWGDGPGRAMACCSSATSRTAPAAPW